MKEYRYNGLVFLFDEKKVPKGAVLLEKQVKPQNKAKQTKNK
jgi:hypothetical protein